MSYDNDYLAHLLAYPTETENLLIASGRSDLHDMFMKAVRADDHDTADLILDLLTPVDPGCWELT